MGDLACLVRCFKLRELSEKERTWHVLAATCRHLPDVAGGTAGRWWWPGLDAGMERLDLIASGGAAARAPGPAVRRGTDGWPLARSPARAPESAYARGGATPPLPLAARAREVLLQTSTPQVRCVAAEEVPD